MKSVDTFLVMLVAKKLHITEWNVCAVAVFYNSGKGFLTHIYREDVDEEYEAYLRGVVHQILEDFLLDYLANRIPPNLLLNALNKQCEKSTKHIKVRKGK